MQNNPFCGQTLQCEMWSGTAYAVKLSDYKDMVRHSNVVIKKNQLWYVFVVGIVAMCRHLSTCASASKTWPRPGGSGLDLVLGLRVLAFALASFNTTECIVMRALLLLLLLLLLWLLVLAWFHVFCRCCWSWTSTVFFLSYFWSHLMLTMTSTFPYWIHMLAVVFLWPFSFCFLVTNSSSISSFLIIWPKNCSCLRLMVISSNDVIGCVTCPADAEHSS